jgi:MFS superfamily sulfate permease-like transporter
MKNYTTPALIVIILVNVLGFLLSIGVTVGIAYAAVHFINKFW